MALKGVLNNFLVLLSKIPRDRLLDVIGDVLNSRWAVRSTSRCGLPDVKIEIVEISYGQDDTWGWPGSNCWVRVLVFEPRRHGTWVTTANRHPLSCWTRIVGYDLMIFGLYESIHISESLCNVKILERLSSPIGERLRVTVVSVFENIEKAFNILANLICVAPWSGRPAPCLSTYPKEDWPVLLVPELIIHEIPLLICASIISEMIDLIREVIDLKVLYSKLLIHFFLHLGCRKA